MKFIASLPWYDVADCRSNLDRFWSVLRATLAQQGVANVAAKLNRSTPLARQWADPALLLSQCCGPDLFTATADNLVAIGRPVFSQLDCDDGDYFSYIVAARAEPADCIRIAVNSPSSHSGCAVLLHWLAARSLACAEVLVSGSHEQSLELLRKGRADFAAIDAQSWGLINTSSIDILDRTTSAPAPPYVSHRLCPVAADLVTSALAQAIDQAGHLIGINGLVPARLQTYQAMRNEACALQGIIGQPVETEHYLSDRVELTGRSWCST